MKELKPGESLDIGTVFDNSILSDSKVNTLEKVRQIVFTDGVIDNDMEKENKFFIGNRVYEFNIDTLKERKISFKDYSYVISFLVAERRMHSKRTYGIIDDVSIYLANKHDFMALKKAYDTLRAINELFNVKKDCTINLIRKVR